MTTDAQFVRPKWPESTFREGVRKRPVSISADGRGFSVPLDQLPDQDSNLDKQNQNLLCYRYTIGQAIKRRVIYRMSRMAGKVQTGIDGEFLTHREN